MNWKPTAVMVALAVGLGLYVGLVESKKPADDATKQEERVLRFDPKDMQSLLVTDGGQKISLTQAKGVWKMDRPGKMDRQVVDSALESLKRLDSRRLVADKPTPEDLKTSGLEKPTRTLAFTWATTGDNKPAQLAVGGENLDKTGYFIQLQPHGAIHMVDKWSLDTVLKWAATPPVKADPKAKDEHGHED